MVFLVKLGQFLLSLSILIVLHEMGHFLFARLFKTRVEKFYLFFDPWFAIFKKKIGDTEYGIGWLPLGGYVKISGMIDESMDREQMAKPAQPWEFRSKKAWQRLIIMLGGVTVNFILALFIYIMVFFTWGEKYVPNQNLEFGVMVDSLGKSIGLQNGDKVLSLDGEVVDRWETISGDIWLQEAQTITIDRDGKRIDLSIDESILPELSKSSIPFLPRVPFLIFGLSEGDPAIVAGLQVGDLVTGLNGRSIQFWDQFKSGMIGKSNDTISVQVERDGKALNYTMVCRADGMIGIAPRIDEDYFFELFEEVEMKYSLIESVPAGIKKGYETSAKYLKSLGKLFQPKYKAHESLGGFITIGSIFPSRWDWESFWNLTAFLSIMLAIMNLLPIPALDGGHVLFLLYEIVSGRKPGDKFLEYSQMVGMILLLALLLYANLNDVIGLFNK